MYYPQKTEDAAVAILAMAFSSYSLTSLRKVRCSSAHVYFAGSAITGMQP